MDEIGRPKVLDPLPESDLRQIQFNMQKPFDQMNPKLTNPFRPNQI